MMNNYDDDKYVHPHVMTADDYVKSKEVSNYSAYDSDEDNNDQDENANECHVQ